MTAVQFQNWLHAMKAAGLARSDAAAGRLLGVGRGSVLNYKERGCNRTVALACRALIHRMEPWS